MQAGKTVTIQGKKFSATRNSKRLNQPNYFLNGDRRDVLNLIKCIYKILMSVTKVSGEILNVLPLRLLTW